MLQGEHSAILSTFIKLPFVFKTYVLSILEWPFYTGFTVHLYFEYETSEAYISPYISAGLSKPLLLDNVYHVLANLFLQNR